MGKCINHPDRETSYLCMKHNYYMCEECLQCRDPELYCKFRSSCPIWFMSNRKQKWDAEDRESAAATGGLEVTFSNPEKQVTVPSGA